MLSVILSLFSFVHLLSSCSQFSLKSWCFVEANPVAVQLCCCAEQQPITHHPENHTKLGKNNCLQISRLSILSSLLQYSREQGVKYSSNFIVHQLFLVWIQGSFFNFSARRNYFSFSLHFLLGNSLHMDNHHAIADILQVDIPAYLIHVHSPSEKEKGRSLIFNCKMVQCWAFFF